jgi:hypothetical protein
VTPHDDDAEVAQRVRVTAPVTGKLGAAAPIASDVHRRDPYGAALLRSLIRAQLAVSVSFLAIAICLLVAVPLVVSAFPSVARLRVAGLPIVLVLLGIAVYPVLAVLGRLYVRRAERVEARFAELVDSDARDVADPHPERGLHPPFRPVRRRRRRSVRTAAREAAGRVSGRE